MRGNGRMSILNLSKPSPSFALARCEAMGEGKDGGVGVTNPKYEYATT